MIYGDGLLTITPEGISIDTALTAREAGTAKLSQHQTEPGVIISISDDGTVTYGSWRWTGSHEDIAPGRKVYSVYVDGEVFEGKPLLDIMEEADSVSGDADGTASSAAREKFRTAVNALSRAVEDAAEKGISLPDNGPLGTLIADDGRILLLPENIFVRALDSRSDRDASRFAGCWKNTGLQPLDGWRFTLACYAYRYVSGRAAFPQEDSQIRAADYFDRNFIPLEWFCTLNGLPADADQADLFKTIRTNLSKAAPVQENTKQKKKKSIKRSSIEDINSIALPVLPVYESRTNSNFALTEEYVKQQKKLKKIRFIRQNNLAIKWCSIGAIVLLLFAGSLIKDKLTGPSTKGMEPVEVLTWFYDSFDQLNATDFDVIHTDNCAKDASSYLSTMFVTAKMRQSYEGMGTYTMNQWLTTKVLAGTYVFGITNLNFTPLSEMPPEQGPANTDNEYSWKVHYYIVYNMGNEEFSFLDQTDIITISWKSGKWMVTGFETISSIVHEDEGSTLMNEAISLQPDEYTLDQGFYLLSQLKDKYPWLPTEEEIAKGREQLLNGWNATEYQKVLRNFELN